MSHTKTGSFKGKVVRKIFGKPKERDTAPPVVVAHDAVSRAVSVGVSVGFAPPSSGRTITEAKWLAAKGRQEEVVRLRAKVNSLGAPNGTDARFEVFHAETEESVEVIETTVDGGQAVAEFTWEPEDDEPPEEARLSFIVQVAGDEEEARAIPFEGKGYFVRFALHVDPDDPAAKDESATLESDCGGYTQKRAWVDGEAIDKGVVLEFTKLRPDKKYHLRLDPGRGGTPFYVARNLEASKEQLKSHMAG